MIASHKTSGVCGNLNGGAGQMGHTWYVTFHVQRRGTLPRARHPRLTKSFETEAEAKKFAREKFDQGLTVTAGTLNPFSPKQVIPPSAVASWLEARPCEKGGAPGDVKSTSQTIELLPSSKDRS
jgi:hypothetical protein